MQQPGVHRNAPDQYPAVVNLDSGKAEVAPPYAVCVECGSAYVLAERFDVCPKHSGLEGILEVKHDTIGLRREGYSAYLCDSAESNSLLRYSRLMPVGEKVCAAVPLGWVTRTPLIDASRLAAELGVASLRVKDEGRNATGSLKDRSSALAAVHAMSLGIDDIACASTGNAASSLAGIAAHFGLRAHIFVPEGTPKAKLDQLAAFGAEVFVVDGSYDDAYYLAREVSHRLGWYDRNCATNPILVEGKKTCGLELAEQMASAEADWVSVAVGDGCTVIGLAKGLAEMHELGILRQVPRILAVQPEGAAPIATSYQSGDHEVHDVEVTSEADSISVGRPRNARRAMAAVRRCNGVFSTVSDEAMHNWRSVLSRTSGIFAELGAAAGIAGVAQAVRQGVIGRDDHVVHVCTGTGLKDAGSYRGERVIRRVGPRIEDVRAAMQCKGRSPEG